MCVYICVECCGTSFVYSSVVRGPRLSAVFGTKVWCADGLAVGVYVTVNNINMGVI